MQPQKKNVLSPLTKTADVSCVGFLSAKDLISRWKQSFEIDIVKQLKGIEKIEIYKCNITGLVFFWPRELAGDESLYKQLSKFNWYYMENKWEYEQALKDLNGCNRVLEIGCGCGAFLEKLRMRGANAEGIETNPEAAGIAVKKGLRVFSEQLDKIKVPYLYDAICSFQTLEHVVYPREFLNTAIQYLRPGGKLILSVPNHGAFIKHVKNPLLEQPPHHMSQWTKKTFQTMQDIFSLTLIKWRAEPLADYHVNWYLSICPWPSLLNKFKRIALKSNLIRRCIQGHTMYAVFIKR